MLKSVPFLNMQQVMSAVVGHLAPQQVMQLASHKSVAIQILRGIQPQLLQKLLGLATPDYQHHHLVEDDLGRKLAKSEGDKSLKALRAEGVQARDLKGMLIR